MKNKFYFNRPLSNLHLKPSGKSEVTSQIIYGEKFSILKKNKEWIKIKLNFDNYIGYIKNRKFENYLIEICNIEAIKKSYDSERGILLITPHLGNIEIIIKVLGKQFNCTIPYSKPNQSYLDKIITLSRERAGVKMVDTDVAG